MWTPEHHTHTSSLHILSKTMGINIQVVRPLLL
uniref:Uncharacterized protein n=1 Tax=Anguilla anguilla TaxID=7936 RepID=A0A0E9SBT6_ANGAN